MLEKSLESPLDYKEIKAVNPKWNQSWICIGRIDAEATIFWPPDVKSQLIRKDSDARKDWRQEENFTTEDEMVGWHPWLNGDEFAQALGDCEGQGNLVCCSPWGRKKLDTTELLNSSRWAVVHSLTELYEYTFLSRIQIWRIIFEDIKSKRLHAHKFLLWFWSILGNL